MKYYSLRVQEADVYDWDGGEEGSYVHGKGGFLIGNYPDIEQTQKALNDFFGFPVGKDWVDEEFINCGRVEDGDGERDDDGKYLSQYICVVDVTERVNWEDAA
jgi:hypothetical protein